MERSIFVLMTAPAEIADLSPAVPRVLDGFSFAADFRYWKGASGKTYLTRGFPIDMAAEFPGAPVILAAVDSEGRREAVWIGIAVGKRYEAALAAARSAGATEAHVHLLAEGALARVRVLRDLRAAAQSGRSLNQCDAIEDRKAA
jgi:hypothetical protein